MWQVILAAVIAFVVAAVLFFALGIQYRRKVAEKEISSAEEEAKRIINESIKSAESKKREALVEAKEEILQARNEYEREVKERRADLQKQERRLQQKEENLDRKTENIEKKEDTLQRKLTELEAADCFGLYVIKFKAFHQRSLGFGAAALTGANGGDDFVHDIDSALQTFENMGAFLGFFQLKTCATSNNFRLELDILLEHLLKRKHFRLAVDDAARGEICRAGDRRDHQWHDESGQFR